MLAARLDAALAQGLLTLPDTGGIAVVEPAEDTDLTALPRERVEVISRRFPVHARFGSAGYAVATAPEGRYALSILCLPRARDEARETLARLVEVTDGPVVVDGAKTDGADGFLRELRRRAEVSDALAKAHGKLFVVWPGADLSDWRGGGDALPAGVFSADGPDPGSAALAAALPPEMKGRVIDLGAGWGYLAGEILKREAVTTVDLVEADHAALEAAQTRIDDARAAFHWADARDFRSPAPADHVVTNPPFHQGRRADPDLGRDFIRAAARLLAPSGTLWLVANRHLPYEGVLEDQFQSLSELDGPRAYKLIRARKPRKSQRRG